MAHEIGTEEHESIWRAQDVSKRPALARGARRLTAGWAGNSDGGKSCVEGSDGSAIESSRGSASLNVPGVTLGAKVTDRGEGEGAP